MARWSVGKNSMSVEQPEKETECRPVRTQIDPLFWANVRVADIHVSHLSRWAEVFRACSREHACSPVRIHRSAHLPLGGWFLLSAEPDIHLLPQAYMAIAED